jgi:putative glutamine amidotransferase
MQSRRPVIGIVSYGRARDPQRYTLPIGYVDACRRAGCRVLIVPPGESAGEVLELIDGLILAGGGDVEPKLYGQEPHPTVYGVEPERDSLELALAREAAARRFPVLGICRGLQVINVALGGDLIQHLPEVVGDAVPHRGEVAGCYLSHPVRVAPASLLAEVAGAEVLPIHSSHHQAIRRLGEGLRASAWSEDEVIEAVEQEGNPQLLAVQWHPEEGAAQDPLQQRIFNWLAQRARENAAGR